METGTMLSAFAMAITAVVWAVRIEGRINVTDTRLTTLFNEIIRRLDRIEKKQDGLS